MTACGACAHSVRGRTALQGQLGTAAGSGRLAGPVPHRGQRAREVGRRLRQGGPRPLIYLLVEVTMTETSTGRPTVPYPAGDRRC
jgi:hypothetical protein